MACATLVWLAIWLLIMHFVDLLWIIEPNYSSTLSITWADILLAPAIGGIWMWYFCRNLNSLPLLAAYDPDAKEVLEPAHG